MYREAILEDFIKTSANEKTSRTTNDDRHYAYNTPLCRGVKIHVLSSLCAPVKIESIKYMLNKDKSETGEME